MRPWPFLTAIVLLLSTVGIMNSISHGEIVLMKKPFSQFPLTISDRWQGKELGLTEDVLEKLRLSDYMMRVYLHREDAPVEQKHRAVPVYLYVGYYQSQRTGATYHSPKNCLPGAGWQIVESGLIDVPLKTGKSITINKVLIQKGLEQQLILYWYHDRGRIIASEYWAKGMMIWDAMTTNRTDGALVRISVPVMTNDKDAYLLGTTFLNDLWDDLIEYMPDSPSKVS